jgi:hypothetical protein
VEATSHASEVIHLTAEGAVNAVAAEAARLATQEAFLDAVYEQLEKLFEKCLELFTTFLKEKIAGDRKAETEACKAKLQTFLLDELDKASGGEISAAQEKLIKAMDAYKQLEELGKTAQELAPETLKKKFESELKEHTVKLSKAPSLERESESRADLAGFRRVGAALGRKLVRRLVHSLESLEDDVRRLEASDLESMQATQAASADAANKVSADVAENVAENVNQVLGGVVDKFKSNVDAAVSGASVASLREKTCSKLLHGIMEKLKAHVDDLKAKLQACCAGPDECKGALLAHAKALASDITKSFGQLTGN